MNSFDEAFARFELWRKAQTSLKLTVIAKENPPEILRGHIISTDEQLFLVSFCVNKFQTPRLDLRNASFQVGKRAVEATRDQDCLVFEES
jgi:hypothetical protein